MCRFSVLLFCLMLSSCITSKFTPVVHYDLIPSSEEKADFTFSDVKLAGPYSRKISVRKGASLQILEYSRWSSSPEELLTRYWELCSTSSTAVDLGKVRILLFEINLDENAAVIVVDVESENGIRRFESKEPVTAPGDDAYIEAMSTAVSKLTKSLSEFK